MRTGGGGAADLALQSVTVTQVNPTPGGSISIRTVTTNIGTATSSSYTISYYASTDTQITNGDILIGTTVPIAGLPSGQTATTNATGNLPGNLPSGTYYIGAILNISDANSANNVGHDPTPITVSSTQTRIINLSGNLAFGNVQVGSSAQRTLTISNSGNSTLTVSSISYPTGFSGSFSGQIGAGSSQNVTVTFAPTAATNYGGTVTVNSDATSGTNTISASGTGVSNPTRIISLSGNLAFGNVAVGTTAQRTLTISNSGNSTLTVSSISYPTGFSGSFSGQIGAGSSQNVTVTFAPTAATNYGGTVTVNSDATSGTNTISASGTGVSNPTRIIGLSGNLAFGNVAVGSSAQRTLTISNSGNSTLTVSSIGYPTGFSGSFSGQIGPGSSQNVTVTFAPTAATNYGGTVTVNSDATSGTNTIAASGTGTTTIPTPTPNPSCPPTITQSSTQSITAHDSVSCNDGVGHTDNSYWRAFNMASVVGSNPYHVTSVSFGVEQAIGASGTQSVTVRLYTTSNFPSGFPGSLTQIATSTVDVPNTASGTIFNVPLTATVPVGTSQLVMELFTPDGRAAGNLLYVGANADPETGPSYLSAATCGFTTPTTTAVVGFPNMHIVFNVNGNCSTGNPNPIDDPTFFVTQHYSDFLNRNPDQSGLSFWVNQITSCNGDPQCIDIRRQNVSAAFFLSIEFQETGFYVITLQRGAFGRISNDSTRRITFQQFLNDAQQVSTGVVQGQPGWEVILDQNKTAYAQNVVGSAAFINRFPTTLPASAYVDALFASAGVTPTSAERQAAINAFGAGGTTGRAAALRKVAETSTVKNAEFNSAFVLMQYFGYLRRNPTDPPDSDDSGYQFWLNKLNQFNGNFVESEMVKAFIVSGEYRNRFD